MHKLLIWVILLFSLGLRPAFGQSQWNISGVLKDTVNFTSTVYSSISLIRTSDSLLQGFTRADENGTFNLTIDNPGNYILLITHPSFISWVDTVSINKEYTKLGEIPLTSRKQLLEEVIITDARAIVIKGDTIEYAADSFRVRAFGNVDELL